MIVQIIGCIALVLFVSQFLFEPFIPKNDEVRGFYIIDNSLLLIAAAICFK